MQIPSSFVNMKGMRRYIVVLRDGMADRKGIQAEREAEK